MRLLASSVTRYRGRVAAALVLLVIAKLSVVAVPLALKGIIDHLSRPERVSVLPVSLLLAYALLRFSGTLFGELRDLVFSRAAQQTVADFSARAFEHLLSLSPRFHVMRQTGRLIRDVERGTAGIGFLLGVGLFTIVPTLVEIVAVVAIMSLNYSQWFTAIIGATFIAYTCFTVYFTERRAVHQRAVNELDSTANSRMVDSLLNYEVVKSHANERFEISRFGSIMRDWVGVGVQNQRALFLLHVGQSAIIAVGVASVMLLAGQGVVAQQMTVGDLVLINAYVIQICLPLNALGFVFRQAKDAMVNAEKLFDLLSQQPDMVDGARPLEVRQAEVVFENVEFAYEPGRKILQGVSLRIPPGRKVAVVGGSGSGKSTLARLLLRFYDPDAGVIRIDGQDLREVTQESLRRAIGTVPQDTILFNQTIAYNIRYARPDATMEEIIEAARAAHIHDFIERLPQGYDTVVGERGLKLSGGEKQRIAIARVILKNPAILIFDEATSALDARSERAIQDELDRIAVNRTTLVIAHRMSTVVNADEILVMEQGRIVERGGHDALLARRGLYAQLWSLQQRERELARAEDRLQLHSVNLAPLVSGVIDSLQPEIERKGVHLYTVIASRDVLRVTGDPDRLRRMVAELCACALEASRPRDRVEVDLERNGQYARLRIALAEGVRMPQPALATLIAEQHGGSLQYGASTVTVDLPLRAIGTPDHGARAGALRNTSVVIVDDQEEARELLADALAAHGARVKTLASARTALEWFDLQAHDDWPDVLLCDVGLGAESGHELMRELRLLEASRGVTAASRMPAIALTGFASPQDRSAALLSGFQLHLAKPVAGEELVAAVRSLAGSRRTRGAQTSEAAARSETHPQP